MVLVWAQAPGQTGRESGPPAGKLLDRTVGLHLKNFDLFPVVPLKILDLYPSIRWTAVASCPREPAMVCEPGQAGASPGMPSIDPWICLRLEVLSGSALRSP